MGEFSWDKIPIKTAATADPDAGANHAALTVPAGKRWRFIAGATRWVTDANVANRYFAIAFAPNGTNTTMYIICTTAQTASQTVDYFAANQEVRVGTSQTVVFPDEGIELPPGAVISPVLLSKEVGDNAGVFNYVYKEAPA